MHKYDLRSLTFSNLAAAEKGRSTLAADKKVDPDSIKIREVFFRHGDSEPHPFWVLEWRLKR